MVGGFARIANRITRPLHSTFPAGSGARAHGLRAKAGAPFLSFFLSYWITLAANCRRTPWAGNGLRYYSKGAHNLRNGSGTCNDMITGSLREQVIAAV